MYIRASQVPMFLLFVALCLGGMWWQEKQLYGVGDTSVFATCAKERESEDRRPPDCVLEDIDHVPFSALTPALKNLALPEFLQGGFSADRVSLSLFPHSPSAKPLKERGYTRYSAVVPP